MAAARLLRLGRVSQLGQARFVIPAQMLSTFMLGDDREQFFK